MWKMNLGKVFLTTLILLFLIGSFSYAYASLAEVYSEQIQLSMKEGKAESPELYLLNAENELGKEIYKFEQWKRASSFNYSLATGEKPPTNFDRPWPPQVNVLTLEQIEAEEKAAIEEDLLLRATSRNLGKEILDNSIKSIRSGLCLIYTKNPSESGDDFDLPTITHSVLPYVLAVIMEQPSLKGHLWGVAPIIVMQVVPFIVESGMPKFCYGFQPAEET